MRILDSARFLKEKSALGKKNFMGKNYPFRSLKIKFSLARINPNVKWPTATKMSHLNGWKMLPESSGIELKGLPVQGYTA